MGQYWSARQQGDGPIFVSLGMVVLDERRYPSRETLYDVPGGSGLFATLGARLIQASSDPARVGCIILAGFDFPRSLLGQVQAWKLTMQVKWLCDKPSTRGLLEYQDDNLGRKTFRYLTPPLQPWPSDLASALSTSDCFHILATPHDLGKHVAALSSRHTQEKPVIVWEPAPPSCEKTHLKTHLEACRQVHVFSPNHLELASLVRGGPDKPSFSRQATERDAQHFLDAGVGHRGEGIVVIRCGEHGCKILTRCRPEAEWFPAFYDSDSPKIVDTTGAGNAFLGGFAVGLQTTKDARQAAILGSVAASFALEQVGLPKCTPASWLHAEKWNGSTVLSRISEFKSRMDLVNKVGSQSG
ncbi:hypothetical protein F66182_9232 [Fusarium sp. NRRL 66182]|nr:hypothetical protein F66182_9232 [Fusarium sp. NRRL 66182]